MEIHPVRHAWFGKNTSQFEYIKLLGAYTNLYLFRSTEPQVTVYLVAG